MTSTLLAPNLSLGGTTTGTFSGPLTGNVAGNVSGSAASFSGAVAGDVTGTQGATVVAAPTVTGKALTGFVSGAGTVSASDSILTAINKLAGNAAIASPPVFNPSGNFITTVDSAGFVGEVTSITLGADGLPVISYYDNTNGDLKVAKCGNAACTGVSTLTTVDSAGIVGLYTSITLGADGLPVISYYDVTNGNLKVAKCVNAACTGVSTLTTVDSAGSVGQHTSITLGADGLPVIGYSDGTNFDLKVAKCTSATCVPFVRRR